MGFRKRNFTFADVEVEETRKSEKTLLDKIEKLVNWREIDRFLKKRYTVGKKRKGEQAYSPLTMFKVLIIQNLYNLSDPGTEENLRDRISFLRFCGFSLSEETPDHSTICRFRKRLLEIGILEELFEMINAQLEQKGFLVRTGTIIDASLVKSSRRPKKQIESSAVREDREEKREDTSTDESKPTSEEMISYSDDKDARWVAKGKELVYGYKMNVASDGEGKFIVAAVATPANVHDIQSFRVLVEKARVEEGGFVLADKGYASKENDILLRQKGYKNGIMKKAKRNHPLSEKEKKMNKAISAVRYCIEQIFGHLKRHLGFSRLRYVGGAKAQMELHLKAIAYNLKMGSLALES